MTNIESFPFPEKARVSGAGDCDQEDLQSGMAEATVSGSGKSKLRVPDALTMHVGATGDWGSIFGDQMIASAILERLLPLRDCEEQAGSERTCPGQISITPKKAMPGSPPARTEASES